MDEQQGEKQLQQTEQQQELAGAAAAAVRDAAAAADAGQVTSASDAKSDNAAASGLGGLLDQLPKLPQTLSEQAVRVSTPRNVSLHPGRACFASSPCS